ncbi:DMT family transporter [Streptomyces tsukubensis]|uniref:EamA family transporter n=1 Tax=Streptomyces tsukubensis TaxID=83656 RepID=A0A1V4AF56_9ACTN|nr:DMT family transporter [Streptomyces tsukubensis]OON82194.1 EamA family transporter [Streptomyces tsukubensis]QFR92681.1 EamA family transporter [Streptomyces tsukubensis]
MRDNDSATPVTAIAVPPTVNTTPAGSTTGSTGSSTGAGSAPPPGGSGGSAPRALTGTLLASLGVVAFSLTFPSTAWGLESFGPWSLVAARGVLAAVVAAGFLVAGRVRIPDRAHWAGLAVVGAGVVIGFPMLTTLALETSTTSHAAVVVGLLPLTTSVCSALRTGQWPSGRFWGAALAGASVVGGFTVFQSGGVVSASDLYLFAALLVCAAGYTEGGRLARLIPGWQVVGWALVLCLPVTVVGGGVALAFEPVRWTAHGAIGLVWVALGSTFFGLYVWYRGMAVIGVARASQLQLAQPLLTLVWSVGLLGEHLSPAAPLAAVAVLACIAVTQRARR